MKLLFWSKWSWKSLTEKVTFEQNKSEHAVSGGGVLLGEESASTMA